ncbi:hypothetical protein [Nonomuraea pusilla]|uniref:Uncharacterized protein n=1 Tax=Nonomuraea pusilla TaxID=46177 RepID=A0A1H8KD06_9ACTN|nr:hypothetical protein [Nonomuraea pusilla]SEN90298.1 hypothetical protein SAMN05660976_08569 [Nonomuraea pusilla]
MSGKPLYSYVNGEPMVSDEAMALLIGVPYERVRAEIERQRAENPGSDVFRMPRAWSRQGNRIRKEVQAALGYEAGMKECIDYLAAKAGLTGGGES